MKMNYLFVLLAVLLLAGCAAETQVEPVEELAEETPVEPAEEIGDDVELAKEPVAEILILDKGVFDPNELTVTAGTEVAWRNNGKVKIAIYSTEGSEIRSPKIEPGETFSHVFGKAGAYTYITSFGKKGKVIVE